MAICLFNSFAMAADSSVASAAASAAATPRFTTPVVGSTGDGWGPSDVAGSVFAGIPYQPFSRGDRLGKVRDVLSFDWVRM